MLDAIIERMTGQILVALQPMIDDPALDAPAKLDQFFARTQSWKLANREFLLDVLAVVYREENTVLRMKIVAAIMPIVVPLSLIHIYPQRRQDVDHRCAGGELLHRLRQDRSGRAAHGHELLHGLA